MSPTTKHDTPQKVRRSVWFWGGFGGSLGFQGSAYLGCRVWTNRNLGSRSLGVQRNRVGLIAMPLHFTTLGSIRVRIITHAVAEARVWDKERSLLPDLACELCNSTSTLGDDSIGIGKGEFSLAKKAFHNLLDPPPQSGDCRQGGSGSGPRLQRIVEICFMLSRPRAIKLY